MCFSIGFSLTFSICWETGDGIWSCFLHFWKCCRLMRFLFGSWLLILNLWVNEVTHPYKNRLEVSLISLIEESLRELELIVMNLKLKHINSDLCSEKVIVLLWNGQAQKKNPWIPLVPHGISGRQNSIMHQNLKLHQNGCICPVLTLSI